MKVYIYIYILLFVEVFFTINAVILLNFMVNLYTFLRIGKKKTIGWAFDHLAIQRLLPLIIILVNVMNNCSLDIGS